MSFTTDVWTNPTNTCSLLRFTEHFVHQSKRCKVILSVMELDTYHTDEYIASKLKEAVRMWNLDIKVHLGIRDNAANMICAMQMAEITGFGCVSHTGRIVHAGISGVLLISSTVNKLVVNWKTPRSPVVYLHTSSYRTSKHAGTAHTLCWNASLSRRQQRICSVYCCSPQKARMRPARPRGKCVYFGTQLPFLC